MTPARKTRDEPAETSSKKPTKKAAKKATAKKAAAKAAKAEADVTRSRKGAAPTAPTPTPPAAELTAARALADDLAGATHPSPTTPEALAVWLVGRRWFAGTQGDDEPAAPDAVALSTVALPTEPALSIGVADLGGGRCYQLLVPGDAGADRPDVGDDPASAAELARWVAAGGRADDGGVVVAARWTAGPDALGDAPARPLGGEQSNTSVVVGGTHVLKLFRRLQGGEHPEIEVGRHLADVAADGVPAPVAPLAGWYELRREGDEPVALGVVQDLVPGALDAWGLVLSALAGDPGALLARLHRLGSALAELHGALARPGPAGGTDDASFGSRPLTPDRIDDLVEAVATDARRVLATTLDRPDELAAVAGRADDVATLAARLAASLGDDLGAAIRHHGDLHLGQVVDSHVGWVILDFEGEPSRPLAERRRRHSPLRDVAGMLRSFAYAAATHRRADGHRLSDGWEPGARAAFLDGYLSTVEPALLPDSAAATRTLLSLLELEKVVYEIDYELAHRPDWVGLPVDGLRRLLAEGRA